MKNFNKYILEAVKRGIHIALDDYEDELILTLKASKIEDKNLTYKELWLIENFIDLGLPTKTLWAKYNLGCNVTKLNNNSKLSKPDDWYGDYYAWGEIEPKNEYNWTTYKYGAGTKVKPISSNLEYRGLTKYSSNEYFGYNDFTDNLETLQLTDDAAYVKTNGTMRIPSYEEINELLKFTTLEFILSNYSIRGLNGLLLKSKINGKELFIPASGWKDEKLSEGQGECGYIWCNSIKKDILNDIADSLGFDNENWVCWYGYGANEPESARSIGLTIRPVFNKFPE